MVLSGDGAEAGTAAAISLWTTNDIRTPDDWVPQTVAPASIPSFSGLRIGESGEPGVALSSKNFALLSKPAGGQTLAECRISVGSLSDASPLVLHSTGTLPEGVFGLWQQPDRIVLGDSGVWWTYSGIVFHSTPSGNTEAYMPWNGAGDDKHGHIACLLADDKGVWVAADTGIHRITPDHPTNADGFGGYMRIALGPNTAQPPANSVCQKLNQLTQQWQGVPYKWGGDSKSGIDCSGYVCKLFEGVGINVPRATTELGNGSEGKRIRDDLKYGDVLVFPGHCAMYIGNGWTTEALDQGVGKAAIWSRKNVVIKRFLKS
jgi:cell wall-associated NlpC family hydrolase